MRRIVVLGCGFGGFRAARKLQRELASRRRVQLTIVSDRSHFLYTPLLAHVATGELDLTHITFPLRAEFDKSTEVLIEHIEHIDLDGGVLRGQSSEIDFDYLLVATGAGLDWRGHEDWRAHALSCHSGRDAVRLHHALGAALEDASQMNSPEETKRRLTFVIAGGGPTGVELAAELLSTLRAHLAPPASERLAGALRVIVVEEQQRVLPRWPDELGELARTHLRSLGMEFRTGTAVVDRSKDQVELSTGETIAADNFIWCGGVRVAPLVAEAGFDVDPLGRVVVDQTLQARAHPCVYAVGDAAGPSADTPQSAHVATQQAPVAAHNIIADLSGRGRRDWQFEPRGHLLGLGRRNALAYLGETCVEGRPASTLYRLVHTALMPTAIKKAHLVKDWLFSKNPGANAAKQLPEGDDGPIQLEADDSP